MRDHGDPAQALAIGRDELGIGRLGDRGDRAAMAGEILDLGRGGAGVGGDRDGAELDTGKPGEQRLDAIVEMDQHVFARLDAALDEAGGEHADALMEFAVGPDRAGASKAPDQERTRAAPRRAC